MTISTLVFEAETYLDKGKIKKVYLVGLLVFLLSVGCIFWAIANWDAYTEIRYSLKYGRNIESGLASILYGWGWAFAIAMPICYGLLWMTLDFKNPIFAVNKDGIFVNRELFKKTFFQWNEFDRIEEHDKGALWLYFKDPAKIVSEQSGPRKILLKQTYIKNKSPMTLEGDGDFVKINEFILKYWNK
ncbi:MAG: hypothetical protein GQ574_18775 [Crocinitomix sp.]|nr:hypothetical protein [Crocinitomix sp.]